MHSSVSINSGSNRGISLGGINKGIMITEEESKKNEEEEAQETNTNMAHSDRCIAKYNGPSM